MTAVDIDAIHYRRGNMKRTALKRSTPLKSKGTNKRPPATEKAKAARASAIRRSAAGKPCLVRIPGICNGDPETTVCAHIRIPGLAGTGTKPPDILSVRACSACHDRMDGRRNDFVTPDELARYVHEAHCRTLVAYLEEGLITMDGA